MSGSIVAAKLTVAERISHAYYLCSKGRANVRVWLGDLRERLADLDRRVVDAELLRMDRSGDLSLYTYDGPESSLTKKHLDGVLFTPSGSPRHLVYLGGARS